MEMMIVMVILAAPMLAVWAVIDFRHNRLTFGLSLAVGVAYIASFISLLNGVKWGGGWLFGHEITVLLVSSMVIWIGALVAFLRPPNYKHAAPPQGLSEQPKNFSN